MLLSSRAGPPGLTPKKLGIGTIQGFRHLAGRRNHLELKDAGGHLSAPCRNVLVKPAEVLHEAPFVFSAGHLGPLAILFGDQALVL